MGIVSCWDGCLGNMKSRKRLKQVVNSPFFNYVVVVAGLALVIVFYMSTQTGEKGRQRFQERQTSPETEINFTVIAEGSEAYGYSDSQGQIISTRAEWEALWHTLHLATIPRPVLPEVDFTQQLILVVFAGEKSGSGYMVTVKKVVKAGQEVIVYAAEQRAKSNQASDPQPTYPFQIVTIARPEAPVAFRFQ